MGVYKAGQSLPVGRKGAPGYADVSPPSLRTATHSKASQVDLQALALGPEILAHCVLHQGPRESPSLSGLEAKRGQGSACMAVTPSGFLGTKEPQHSDL